MICAANRPAKLDDAANMIPAAAVAANAIREMFMPPTRSVHAPPMRLKTICTMMGSAIRLPIATPE